MGKPEESIIDFTACGNFRKFNNSVKKYLAKLKTKNKKWVKIIDYIYPLKQLKKKTYAIVGHINLSGENPLTGPHFISLSDLYVNAKKDKNKSKTLIYVSSLKEGSVPNDKEKKIRLKANIKAYCYNLVPAAIYGASCRLKVKAFGVLK